MSKTPVIIGDTKNLTEEEWLKWRAHGKNYDNPKAPDYIPVTVGGSLVASIFNVSPWSNALEAYNNKIGVKPAITKEENSQAKRAGHIFEPFVAEMFLDWCNRNGHTCTVINDTNMYQHPDYPFALANIDRLIEFDGKKGILECKTTNLQYISEWSEGRVPIYYELQCRFYMEVMDLDFCYICCCWGFKPYEMAVVRIDRDIALGKSIMEKCAEFVDACIKRIPPSTDNIAAENLLAYYIKLYGEAKKEFPTELSFDSRDIVDELLKTEKEIDECKARIKALEKQKIDLAKPFIEVMEGNDIAIYDFGDEKAEITLKIPHYANGFDIEGFKRDYPDLYKKAEKITVDMALLKDLDTVVKNKYTIKGEINPDKIRETSVSAKLIKPKKKTKK